MKGQGENWKACENASTEKIISLYKLHWVYSCNDCSKDEYLYSFNINAPLS